jgi:general secretion pathway protein G
MVNKQVSGFRSTVSAPTQGTATSRTTPNSTLTTDLLSLTPEPCTSGFTLLELIVVMLIISILSAIAIPAFQQNIKHAREAVLKEDLHTMRDAIEAYTFDKEKAPQSLDDLVQSHYLRELPRDPFTQRNDTWIPSQGDAYVSIDETQSGGITDVHSGSQNLSSEGTTYNTW